MAQHLERPETFASIYLTRGDDTNSLRPVMQGDVFEGVAIPGVDDEGNNLAVVTSHPCSMRTGVTLRTHLQVARVLESPSVPLEGWQSGHYRVMPLPDLFGNGRHFAADFELVGRVRTADLDPSTRIACLDAPGILLLQQRLVHYLTRVIVDTDTLLLQCDHVLEEADLLEEWLIEADPPDDASTHVAELAFDHLLAESAPGEKSLRELLKDPKYRPAVRRRVRAAATGMAIDDGAGGSG